MKSMIIDTCLPQIPPGAQNFQSLALEKHQIVHILSHNTNTYQQKEIINKKKYIKQYRQNKNTVSEILYTLQLLYERNNQLLYMMKL